MHSYWQFVSYFDKKKIISKQKIYISILVCIQRYKYMYVNIYMQMPFMSIVIQNIISYWARCIKISLSSMCAVISVLLAFPCIILSFVVSIIKINFYHSGSWMKRCCVRGYECRECRHNIHISTYNSWQI